LIRIAISPAAYEAIERTLALGTVAVEPQVNEKGERLIWLQERQVDSIGRPGGSYSEAIIPAVGALGRVPNTHGESRGCHPHSERGDGVWNRIKPGALSLWPPSGVCPPSPKPDANRN
jgi:hypothetical protein